MSAASGDVEKSAEGKHDGTIIDFPLLSGDNSYEAVGLSACHVYAMP